ncbi:hypothetical protein E2320_020987 [Naja naja]|nr:hypothetical protein E2320_020987 [Naja naja]
MAPKEATPAQGTQGSLVNKPQVSASGIPSIYETDLPQDNFWNLEEIQLFDSFCALPQPERAQIIKRLDAVKSKLWSLSLPDKDPLGFQDYFILRLLMPLNACQLCNQLMLQARTGVRLEPYSP